MSIEPSCNMVHMDNSIKIYFNDYKYERVTFGR